MLRSQLKPSLRRLWRAWHRRPLRGIGRTRLWENLRWMPSWEKITTSKDGKGQSKEAPSVVKKMRRGRNYGVRVIGIWYGRIDISWGFTTKWVTLSWSVWDPWSTRFNLITLSLIISLLLGGSVKESLYHPIYFYYVWRASRAWSCKQRRLIIWWE